MACFGFRRLTPARAKRTLRSYDSRYVQKSFPKWRQRMSIFDAAKYGNLSEIRRLKADVHAKDDDGTFGYVLCFLRGYVWVANFSFLCLGRGEGEGRAGVCLVVGFVNGIGNLLVCLLVALVVMMRVCVRA